MGGENDTEHATAHHSEGSASSQTGPVVDGPGMRRLQAVLAPSVPPQDTAALVAGFPEESRAMMAYIAKTAGNGYVQRVLVALPLAGAAAAMTGLESAGLLFQATPEVVEFPATEVGAVSAAQTIRLATTSPAPVELQHLSIHPLHSGDPCMPGELVVWNPTVSHFDATRPIEIDVQCAPARRIAHLGGMLRLQLVIGGQVIHHDIKLVGSGTTPKPENAAVREDSIAQRDGRALAAGMTKAMATDSYADMLTAVYAARQLTRTNDRGDATHAREVLAPVSRRLDELFSTAGEKLSTFGAGKHAGLSALSMSQAAVADWVQKLSFGSTIETEHLVREFQIGSETIRYLTGEISDAKDLRGFDYATKRFGGGAAAVVMAPAMVALAVETLPLLTLLTPEGASEAIAWGLANPVLATEIVTSLVGAGSAINSWSELVDAMKDPHEAMYLVMQIGMEALHLHSATNAGGVRSPVAEESEPLPSGVHTRVNRRIQALRDAFSRFTGRAKTGVPADDGASARRVVSHADGEQAHARDSTGDSVTSQVRGSNLPEYAISKSDIVPRKYDEPTYFEVALEVPRANGYPIDLGNAVVQVGDGVPLDLPYLNLRGHPTIDGVDHSVHIYERTTPSTDGTPTKGEGARFSLTDFLLETFENQYRTRFGRDPEGYSGSLIDSNRLNFQREYVRLKERMPREQALVEAVRRTSFGRHRIPRGYTEFKVDVPRDEPIDLGDGYGVQLAPPTVDVEVRKK